MQQGTLYVICGPSGVGKSSLVKALVESTTELEVSVSHTTRQARMGEQNGVNYNFVTEVEFMDILNRNGFFEHAHIFGNYYGTSQQWVTERLNTGVDVILEIDWQGAQQIRRLKPETLCIFILPPSRTTLEGRLRKRSTDSDEIIKQRLHGATLEMSHYVEFDYLVINDDFAKTLFNLQTIIFSQRLTQTVQARENQRLLAELLAE